MNKTRVIASSILMNSFLFPLFRAFGPGKRLFFCFVIASPYDEGKPETENTLPSRRKIVRLPCLQVWLDASMGELRFAEKDIRQYPGPHERSYRFRSKEERRSRAMNL